MQVVGAVTAGPAMRADGTGVTFVLGGARSGKSAYAEGLVTALPGPWTYVATAEALDEEMKARVAAHRARRGRQWHTIDAPRDLPDALAAVGAGRAVLVDCLTFWVSNLMLAESDLDAARERLVVVLRRPSGPWVLVSNETGLGIVPDNPLSRRFRDAAGLLHQAVASVADRVVLVAAGLPLVLKSN